MENLKINLELTVAHVNAVLKYLAKGAYEEVTEVIASIHSQAKPQVESAQANSAPLSDPETPAEPPIAA